MFTYFTFFKKAFFDLFISSLGYPIELAEGHFCPNKFIGIHLKPLALVSILVSVWWMGNVLQHAS